MKRLFLFIYSLILICLAIFSWGFIDINFPLHGAYDLSRIVWLHRDLSTVIYLFFVTALFVCYGYLLYLVFMKKVHTKYIFTVIGITVVILFFSWPAFAYDIFNYIATAKLTFIYKENPYLVMPIEIPNEPMLAFMHAANKVALYGFVWIALTGIPLALGFGNLLATVFTFKGFVLLFYLLLLWLIWQISGKNLKALTFFALNPLVILETMVSGHNDVVMMAPALAAFYAFQKNKVIFSVLFLFLSIFIKMATIVLVPVFVYLFYMRFKHRKTDWEIIWQWSALLMFAAFFFAPIREEIYSWYLIWPLTFAALALKNNLLVWISIGFSFGLPLRFAPYLFTGEWSGITPAVKKLVTFIPPALTAVYYEIRKKF